jgi:hypothetical protein
MGCGTSLPVTDDVKVESLVSGIDVISLNTGHAEGCDLDLNPPTLSSESQASSAEILGSHSERASQLVEGAPADVIAQDKSLSDVRLEGEISAKRMLVLKGDFTSTIACPVNMWKAPDFKVYVFVSSTFTDTQIERNIIQEKIAPYLRKIAEEHSI